MIFVVCFFSGRTGQDLWECQIIFMAWMHFQRDIKLTINQVQLFSQLENCFLQHYIMYVETYWLWFWAKLDVQWGLVLPNSTLLTNCKFLMIGDQLVNILSQNVITWPSTSLLYINSFAFSMIHTTFSLIYFSPTC